MANIQLRVCAEFEALLAAALAICERVSPRFTTCVVSPGLTEGAALDALGAGVVDADGAGAAGAGAGAAAGRAIWPS
jgi:hypothetical protein